MDPKVQMGEIRDSYCLFPFMLLLLPLSQLSSMHQILLFSWTRASKPGKGSEAVPTSSKK